VEVRDDHTVNVAGDWTLRHYVGEVREAALVVVAHMHPAVEHYVLPAHREQQTAAAHILAGAQGRYLDVRHFWKGSGSPGSTLLLSCGHLLRW